MEPSSRSLTAKEQAELLMRQVTLLREQAAKEEREEHERKEKEARERAEEEERVRLEVAREAVWKAQKAARKAEKRKAVEGPVEEEEEFVEGSAGKSRPGKRAKTAEGIAGSEEGPEMEEAEASCKRRVTVLWACFVLT